MALGGVKMSTQYAHIWHNRHNFPPAQALAIYHRNNPSLTRLYQKKLGVSWLPTATPCALALAGMSA